MKMHIELNFEAAFNSFKMVAPDEKLILTIFQVPWIFLMN